ncbi:MAG TPA: phosphoenolpyruvate--protein phosphotransferase [Burkholderiaceae bacterium]|nr:phosphoenolpyruvate--protein phosphotransferase [Burkholderiaceae bacterium]
MFVVHGTGIGGGIVVGRAVVLESRLIDVPRYRVEFAARPAETGRLERALATVRDELATLGEELPPDAPAEAGALLDVHAMILDDPSLGAQARVAIESHGQNAEWAFASQAEHLAEQFDQFEDPYLRERGRDVMQVADRVLKALAGSGRVQPPRAVPGEVALVFVAHDVSPADMLQLKHAGGFAIDLGGTASHTAILARSMNVPAVVGLGHASRMVRDDDWVVLDGESGVLVVAPDETVLEEYRHRMALGLLERKQLERLVDVPSATLDGAAVELHANIELPAEAEQAMEAGAAGIGLFRTEFLFMNRAELPGEDEQYEAYRSAVIAMRGRPVTIRTLDVGADKALDGDGAGDPAASPNPALGQRAIRYSLAEPDVFLEQLRAILRAAEHGPVRLLIPMLAHGHEVDQALRLIAQARAQVTERLGRPVPPVPVGGMIEVPAAALTAPFFARRLDFLSIGTNDLVQYTLAIDRADHAVASLYDPFHPAVLQLVAQTIRAAERAGKPVAVCGEMAGDLDATRLLLGMGLRSFSMHPASLLRVKREILRCDASKLRARVARLLAADDPVRVQAALSRLRDG